MYQFEKFHYEMVIKEYHLDTFGHVNNATYLQILEEARWEFVTARGFGLETIRKTGLGPVVLGCQIRFLRELCLREKIVIETQGLKYEKKIGHLRHRIFNENKDVCCDAEMTFGLFDLTNRKLIAPTPEWLRAVGCMEG